MAVSNFKETKEAIDTVFTENWTDTPIQFAGMDFTGTSHEKWINVVYEPSTNELTGFTTDGATISRGSVYVVCWAEYQFDALDLADNVVGVFNTELPSTISNIDHNIIDQGFDPSGKTFVVVRFSIKSYIAVC